MWIWAAALIVLAAVLPSLFVGVRSAEPEARRLALERFAKLSPGDSKSHVEAELGTPDLICPGPDDLYPHQMPGRLPFFDRNTSTWKALAAKTRERWIYPLPYEEVGADKPDREPRKGCRPRYAEGEVGFDAAGNVLWLIALTDEDYVTARDLETR